MSMFMRFLQDEGGATAIEYALIAGSIFLVIIAAISSVGRALTTIFTNVSGGFSGN
jgi:pilus assembly protein Flp/PilA